MQLSKRLQAVADMTTCTGTVCDVGCDHGYVSIYLIQRKGCKKVIAMDVRKGPLERARKHIADYRLEEYIETRLSDGLLQVKKGEADAMVCAGMGGRLMQKILIQGREQIAGMQEMILQPQSEILKLRRFLKENGYVIADENMIWEDGKFYPMMRVTRETSEEAGRPAEFSKECWSRYGEKYGPWLLKKKHPVLKLFLRQELQKNIEILEKLRRDSAGERTDERARQIENENRELEEVLQYMEA